MIWGDWAINPSSSSVPPFRSIFMNLSKIFHFTIIVRIDREARLSVWFPPSTGQWSSYCCRLFPRDHIILISSLKFISSYLISRELISDFSSGPGSAHRQSGRSISKAREQGEPVQKPRDQGGAGQRREAEYQQSRRESAHQPPRVDRYTVLE